MRVLLANQNWKYFEWIIIKLMFQGNQLRRASFQNMVKLISELELQSDRGLSFRNNTRSGFKTLRLRN